MQPEPAFSQREINAIMQSKEAKALLEMMQKNSASGVSQASEALKKGDYAKAASLLKPAVEGPKMEALLQELSRKIGRP